MMNEGPLGENDEKMMREKARTSGFISDFTRCTEGIENGINFFGTFRFIADVLRWCSGCSWHR